MFTYSYSKVVLYDPILHYELNTVHGMTGRHFNAIGRDIVAGAKLQVGVRTGALRKSIHMRHLANFTGQYLWIGSNKDYAYAHHEGTKPHIITPNPPNKVLVFSKGSRIIHTPMVHHPGTKANRYLSDQLSRHIRL
jgi:hypothetical protein